MRPSCPQGPQTPPQPQPPHPPATSAASRAVLPPSGPFSALYGFCVAQHQTTAAHAEQRAREPGTRSMHVSEHASHAHTVPTVAPPPLAQRATPPRLPLMPSQHLHGCRLRLPQNDRQSPQLLTAGPYPSSSHTNARRTHAAAHSEHTRCTPRRTQNTSNAEHMTHTEQHTLTPRKPRRHTAPYTLHTPAAARGHPGSF